MNSSHPYLDLDQIESIVERLGQPQATTVLMTFFRSYCRSFGIEDVRGLYDDAYFARIAGHPVAELVGGLYPVHIFGIQAFDYLRYRVAGRTVLDFGAGVTVILRWPWAESALPGGWGGARRPARSSTDPGRGTLRARSSALPHRMRCSSQRTSCWTTARLV